MPKILIFLLICLSLQNLHAETFRERVKAKIKERLIKREEERPAPNATEEIGNNVASPGDYTLSFSHNGIKRLFKLHVPKSYDKTKATPLLVVLHGGGGDMGHQSDDKLYKQISKSEELGFIVAFPNGYGRFNSGKFATWNAGKCCGDSRDKGIDDVGFIKEMVTKIRAALKVDESKIFATGMSNGAMMSYRLACELPDLFSGIAAVAGTDNTVACHPQKPISVLHIHAKNDDHVLFEGGRGTGLPGDPEKVTDFTSVPATIKKWVQINGCAETPKRVLEKAGGYCDLYTGCKNNVEVKLCVTEKGGHSWPGGEKVRRRAEDPSQVFSANDLMWEFFSR